MVTNYWTNELNFVIEITGIIFIKLGKITYQKKPKIIAQFLD